MSQVHEIFTLLDQNHQKVEEVMTLLNKNYGIKLSDSIGDYIENKFEMSDLTALITNELWRALEKSDKVQSLLKTFEKIIGEYFPESNQFKYEYSSQSKEIKYYFEICFFVSKKFNSDYFIFAFTPMETECDIEILFFDRSRETQKNQGDEEEPRAVVKYTFDNSLEKGLPDKMHEPVEKIIQEICKILF